jgi:uncharacterized BrkB/YihY/UPF0761 family membrane protein
MKSQPLSYRVGERGRLKPHWALFFSICLLSAFVGLKLSTSVEQILLGGRGDLIVIFFFKFLASLMVLVITAVLYFALPRSQIGRRYLLAFGGVICAPALGYIGYGICYFFINARPWGASGGS